MIEKMPCMNKVVPTDLAVKVNGTHEVRYKRLPEQQGLGYEFEVFPKTGALEAVKEVVAEMVSQSYDHGVSWRRWSFREVYIDDELDICRFFVVTFRVRDAG